MLTRMQSSAIWTGRTIALPETRELDRFAKLIEERGAQVFRCPMVSIVEPKDLQAIRAWILSFVQMHFDDLIVFTGEGIERLMKQAEKIGLQASFLSALYNVRKITRGPKPVRVLTALGLQSDLACRNPTTDGIIETLQHEKLQGRTIGIQLYGTEPNTRLMTFLTQQGAHPRPVWPYEYAPQAETDRIKLMLENMASGQIDLIAFTSASQIRRFCEVVRRNRWSELMDDAFGKACIAAVGPIVADELKAQGLRMDLMPPRGFVLKNLMLAIEQYYAMLASKV